MNDPNEGIETYPDRVNSLISLAIEMNDPNEGIETFFFLNTCYNYIASIEMNDPNEGIETLFISHTAIS